MEAIGHLNGLWSAGRGSTGVFRASVTAHMGDFWMSGHPRGSGVGLPVRQQVDDLVRVQIDHDRAERSTAPKRKIIDAQTLYVLSLRTGQRQAPPKNRNRGGDYSKVGGQPRADSAAVYKQNLLKAPPQPRRN